MIESEDVEITKNEAIHLLVEENCDNVVERAKYETSQGRYVSSGGVVHVKVFL